MAFGTTGTEYVAETEGQARVFPVIALGIAGVPGFTAIVISLLLAVNGEGQALFEVMVTITLSPLARLAVV